MWLVNEPHDSYTLWMTLTMLQCSSEDDSTEIGPTTTLKPNQKLQADRSNCEAVNTSSSTGLTTGDMEC